MSVLPRAPPRWLLATAAAPSATHLALDLGFGTFILLGAPDPDLLRTFIEDVAPDVRERVAAVRAQAEPVAATAAELSH